MGTTFGCAQCHDHKYDPFTQKEYFQLFAFFNNTADGGSSTAPEIEWPTPAQAGARAAIRAELTSLQADLDRATKAGDVEPVKIDQGQDRRLEEAERQAIQPATRW